MDIIKKDFKDYAGYTPAQQASGNGGTIPPKEHQFKPGQSGNPAGSPKARTNLWKHMNKFMEMTSAELGKVNRRSLTQSQLMALKLVKSGAQGKGCESERLAKYCVDRDEGKAAEHMVIEKEGLSPEECEDVRKVLKRAFDE